MKLVKPIIAALCLALGLNACANNKESKKQERSKYGNRSFNQNRVLKQGI